MDASDVSYQKISTSVADSLEKLYRAGGLSLVFLFVGGMLVLLGNVLGRFQTATLVFGMFLLACSFGLFAFLHLKGPVRAMQTLRENQQTIDSLQELALELTGTVQTAQGFALRYANELASVVERALPVLLILPGIGGKVRELGLDRVQPLTKMIVGASADAEAVVRDIENALRRADFSILHQYAGQLRGAKEALRSAISGITENR